MEKTITGTVVDKAKKESKNGKDYIELKIQDEEGSDYPVVVRAFDDDMVVQCDSQIKKGSRVALNITQNDQGYRNVVGIAEVISGDGTPPTSTATFKQFTPKNNSPKQVTQAPAQSYSDRDTLIVDQVIFKEACAIHREIKVDIDVSVDLAIAMWERVRERHVPKPEPTPEPKPIADGSDAVHVI